MANETGSTAESASNFTPEAIGFLSAVGVFVVALGVLFLFINKKLCFSHVGGLPCLEHPGPRRKGHRPGVRQGLVNSYGDEDGDDDDDDDEDEEVSSSSDSEEEVLKQFEISVSRSQSFRVAKVNGTETPAQGPSPRRHKFTRLLSDQDEVSTEPSDCEDMEAQNMHGFRDPLSLEAEEGRRSPDSLDMRKDGSLGDRKSLGPDTRPSPCPSRQGPEGSVAGEEPGDEKKDFQNDDATDSSSTWSPEQEQHPPASAPTPPAVSSSPRPPISKCGDLVLSLEYRPDSEKLLVSVVAARDIPDKARSGMDAWQVHVVLLPGKKQRHKTAVQRGSTPQFDDTFRFSRLEPSDLPLSALRFRLYALGGRMSRERMMAEKVLRLGDLNPGGGATEITLVLEPRSNLKSVDSQLSLSAVSQSDSASSTQSLTHGGVPELLVGLTYKATTGRMSVEIIKGSHFRNLATNRAPDTYGRLILLNSVGQEISRCKTSVRRSQPNPVYKETFVFQVALFQLSDVTLMVSVYSRRSMKRKEMVGWLALGQNSSGEEEQLHWQDMKEGRGQQVCRWHVLLDA